MVFDSKLVVRMNPNLSAQVNAAIAAGTKEVFELDIKPEAVRESPVKTGTNRRSIEVEVISSAQQANLFQQGVAVVASIFSQSGYGGYLEIGTRFVDPRPYLLPAFMKFKDKLIATIQARLRAV